MEPASRVPVPSQQVTIPEGPPPTHLIVKLKIEQNKQENKLNRELQTKKAELDKKLDNLRESHLGQSVSPASVLESSLFFSLMDSSVIGPQELDAEEAILEVEATNEALENLRDQGAILNNAQDVVQTQNHQIEQISNLEVGLRHISNIAAQEGTTLVSALTTLALGATASLTATPIVGAVVAGGALLVTGNEIIKMCSRYINQQGVTPPLQAIENAITNIQKANDENIATIQKAKQENEKLNQQMGEVTTLLINLEAKLEGADKILAENIRGSMNKLVSLRGSLMQQSYDINNAISLARESMKVLEEQKSQLDSLLSNKYEIKSEKDLKAIEEKINNTIAQIKLSNAQAYDFQRQSLNSMLKVLESKNNMVAIHHEISEMLGKIEMLAKDLKEAKEAATGAHAHLNAAEQIISQQNERLGELETKTKQVQTDAKIAQDQLAIAKQNEGFGQESMRLGGGAAMGIGGVAGMALLGPGGLAVGLGVGFLTLGSYAARTVHFIRRAQRTQAIEKQKMLFEAAAKGLESSKFESQGTVTVTADYGPSTGTKGYYNVVGGLVKGAIGTDIGEIKSAHAGTVTISMGSIPLTLNFDKGTTSYLYGPDAAQQSFLQNGAIPFTEQQNLSKLLMDELDKGKITPKMVLNLLDQLKQVHIGNEVIVMISPNSDAMKNLRDRCSV